ncbi:AmmeMemoRadiSam system protein B [Halorhabdus amylolytica]|uniref:AmmeMemoRadiSam system protein B n=1 Tax=Halorhabdus amylolytica TaxID=2559573 RepID=UPI0010AB318B|nr:AmmeMemoRadiSam system protein B [Halorhabdus amylolytica]
MTDVRDPAVAGRFYAGTERALREQIDSVYAHGIGPGSRPEVRTGEPSVAGLVVPHAGMPFSGPVAAHAYAALAASGRPKTVVVVGPNHTGVGSPMALPGNDRWLTPLGDVPVATELRDEIATETDATVDDRAHTREHAAEVQLPFLQDLYDGASILPISLRRQDAEKARRLGAAIDDAGDDATVVVASSDFTHYEPHDIALQRDELALDRIRASDPDGLVETVEREGLSVCGYGAIATMLRAVEGDVDVLAHATSGDTAGSKDEVVGYAAVAVE